MSADILQFLPMSEAPNRIRELRMANKLSQQKLGDRVGVSKMTISDLERGNMKLDLDYMRRLADALHVIPADLLPISDNPYALSSEERALIERYREMADGEKAMLERAAEVQTAHRSPQQRSTAA